MIKANEIKIGNLVLRNGFLIEEKDKYKEIKVSHNDITACVVDNTSFKPIPLTEEWLLRFGFEIFKLNNGAYEVNLNDFFTLRFIPKDNWREKDAFYLYSNDDDIGIIIQYIHTFQNTFFALTGQELELK